MDRSWKHVFILSTSVLLVLGFSFHELYKATDCGLFALIAPINESKWEHWKMVLYPMLVVGALDVLIFRVRGANMLFALCAGICVFQAVTFGSIELVEWIRGEAHLATHITTFVLGALAGQLVRYRIMLSTRPDGQLFVLGSAVLLLQIAVFTLFSFRPPRMEYFRDSLSGFYGYHRLR